MPPSASMSRGTARQPRRLARAAATVRRRVCGATIAALLGAASTAPAGTVLFLAGESGEYAGGGTIHTVTAADGTFDPSGTPHAVEMTVTAPDGTWHLRFAAPQGADLAPGVYTVPAPFGSPGGASFAVGRPGRGCAENGEFTVHEIAFDAGGQLVTLAVDFVQHCASDPEALTGALRYRSGDAACAGAADGTPCDDRDPCTAGDACQAGTCAGTDTVSPTCTAESCHVAGCHPATGACAVAEAPDGSPCDDGNPATRDDVCGAGICAPCPPPSACHLPGTYLRVSKACADRWQPYGDPCDDGRADTHGDACAFGACVGCPEPRQCEVVYRSGSTCGAYMTGYGACDDGNACTVGDQCGFDGCTAGTPADCDDGNPCTEDGCDPATGCTHATVPGCWVVAARTVVRASARGELSGVSVRCGPTRCQQLGLSVLLLPGDDTYRFPASQPECRRPTTIPDEVGRVRRLRDGRLLLRPSNRREIKRALRACTGRRATFGGRQWIRMSPDGREFTGVSRARATVFAELPIEETLVSVMNGRLGARPPEPALKPRLRTCAPPLRLRCVAD